MPHALPIFRPSPTAAAVISVAVALSVCGCEDPAGPVSGPDGRAATFTCDPTDTPSDAFVDCVDELDAQGGASFGRDELPDIVLGPPMGGGRTAGSMDVASLGCGGSITLAFDGPPVTDRPGPDLLVFENAFVAGESTFVEPGEVLVSADGLSWFAFACEPVQGDGCAGMTPVLATSPTAAIDADIAGGDAFDLAEVGLAEIRWVRIVDRTRDHYGNDTWCTGAGGGFDLDAVAQVEAR